MASRIDRAKRAREQSKVQQEGFENFDSLKKDGARVDPSGVEQSSRGEPLEIDQESSGGDLVHRVEELERTMLLLQKQLGSRVDSPGDLPAPKDFDVREAREQFGVRVTARSKARLLAIQKHLKMKSQAAALDYVLAYAASKIVGSG